LLVSESYYSNDPGIVAGQTQLPPGCTAGNCVTATAAGSYPQVFSNALVDGSFGVTSRIFLAEMTPWGQGNEVCICTWQGRDPGSARGPGSD
jgi:hypothetical protein